MKPQNRKKRNLVFLQKVGVPCLTYQNAPGCRNPQIKPTQEPGRQLVKSPKENLVQKKGQNKPQQSSVIHSKSSTHTWILNSFFL